MSLYLPNPTLIPKLIGQLARENVETRMSDRDFIMKEIQRFRSSRRHNDMKTGVDYYEGKHHILHKRRTAIGEGGKLVELDNLPNARIVDNQYRKMIQQKVNYLVGQPITIKSDNKQFVDAVNKYISTKKFAKLLKHVSKDAHNCGIAWVYVCYDTNGEFTLKRFDPTELIPVWTDADHEALEYAIRVYEIIAYEGETEKIVSKVEVYKPDGIYYYYISDDGELMDDAPYFAPYFTMVNDDSTVSYNWTHLPIIPFKINEAEQPMILRCKGLQDGLNQIESQWEDQSEEDPRNTILVLVNYDGTNLGEFRRNLAQYGAVKVRSVDGADGDVRTLQIQVNAENYKAIIEQFKKAIIENCMGYDAKDDRLGGQANQMNIKSMYSDIELDTNDTETEYASSLEQLIWFIECHMANVGEGDFEGTVYDIIFNRDIMINESEVIANCKNSIGVISNETIIANHSWVDDPVKELERLKKEREEAMSVYMNDDNFSMKGEDEDDIQHE